MALNGCSLPPFLIPTPCPLASHELYRNKFCTGIMHIKEDSEKDDKFCHRAAVKNYWNTNWFGAFQAAFGQHLIRRMEKLHSNARIIPE